MKQHRVYIRSSVFEQPGLVGNMTQSLDQRHGRTADAENKKAFLIKRAAILLYLNTSQSFYQGLKESLDFGPSLFSPTCSAFI